MMVPCDAWHVVRFHVMMSAVNSRKVRPSSTMFCCCFFFVSMLGG